MKPANYSGLTGKKIGRLKVIKEYDRNNKGEIRWFCECECGNSAIVATSNLTRKNTRSCGCLQKELQKERNEKLHLEAEKRKEEAARLKAIAHNEKMKQRFVKRFNNCYGDFFEYVSGYENIKNNKIIIKCKVCGYERTRTRQRIFEKNVSCPECKNNRKGIEQNLCIECGKEYLRYSEAQTLCTECKTKKEKEKKNLHKRLREAKAKENGNIDYSITLSKLIERDNHICKLCGRGVNEADYIYNGDVFIAGNDYPSIDHIKPLSKGGLHQWNNVQLAHRLCNSLKCDKE